MAPIELIERNRRLARLRLAQLIAARKTTAHCGDHHQDRDAGDPTVSGKAD